MAYEFDVDDVTFLTSQRGADALADAARLPLTDASLLKDVPTLRGRHAPHEAALVETVRARRRAVGKLEDADELLLSDTSLQQSTPSAVAAHRAADIAGRHPGAVVHDVTCSIGSEMLALSAADGLGGVVGSDLDPVRLAMAAHNLRGRSGVQLVRADALAPCSQADVVIADPGRRTARGRTFRLDELDPPLLELLSVYAGRPLVVKCSPGLDYRMLRDRFGVDAAIQVTSLDGGVREACLWTEADDLPERRATVLRTVGDGAVHVDELTSDDSDEVDDPGVDDWIVDPDGAVVRAGLVRHYAHRHRLRQLDPQIAYLTGDTVPAGARGFRIVDRLGVTERALRSVLAAHDCGSLEILVRGLDIDPDRLRRKLKLKGSTPLALVLTRIGRNGVAFVCEPGVRH
ncbi:THUMP-like domain-containing protein [Gordonia liuliyuniae]|uniref:Class I SAM-dependent methyltransferase n=1 Tax=Gordonia liuliyuniae TaxID=2911517 RepID=A0ABS9IWN4_9ACTN|nr:class I SAM-dependent methyltransferase [Gordonia liuliyuniae]MCF8589982.1 class I SAM-dependent methyltransferase [Gordonia liuliyuniae]